MNLTFAKTSNIEELAELKIRCWRSTYKNILPLYFLDNFDKDITARYFSDLLHQRKINLLLLKKGESLIGFCEYSAGKSCIEPRTRAIHVRSLYVDNSFHRQGGGKYLLMNVETYGINLGISAIELFVMLQAVSAYNFYLKMGFYATNIVEQVSFISPPRLQQILLRKEIG
jgi:ribosomal protein S18 acetylase RimI-like enzyme